MDKILTSSTLIIIDGNVVKTYTNPDTEFDELAAEENAAAIWNHLDGRRIFNLIVPDPSTHFTVDARSFKHPEFETLKIAEAIVIRTLGHRILADFRASGKNRNYPIRVFDCENNAMEWFETVKAEKKLIYT